MSNDNGRIFNGTRFTQIRGAELTSLEIDGEAIPLPVQSTQGQATVSGTLDVQNLNFEMLTSLMNDLDRQADAPLDVVRLHPELLRELQQQLAVPPVLLGDRALPDTHSGECFVMGMRVIPDPAVPPGDVRVVSTSDLFRQEYMGEFAEFVPPTNSWKLPDGRLITDECVSQMYPDEFLRADRWHSAKNSGWAMVPDILRDVFGEQRFLFGFRQHLDFLIECLKNVPAEVVVLTPNNDLSLYCWEAAMAAIHQSGLEPQVLTSRQRPYPYIEVGPDGARHRRSRIHFVMSKDNGDRLRGHRPDFIIVKELTRKDW